MHYIHQMLRYKLILFPRLEIT